MSLTEQKLHLGGSYLCYVKYEVGDQSYNNTILIKGDVNIWDNYGQKRLMSRIIYISKNIGSIISPKSDKDLSTIV